MSIEAPENPKPLPGGVLSPGGALSPPNSKGVLQRPEVGSGLQIGPSEAAKGEASTPPQEGEAVKNPRAVVDGMLARLKAEDRARERAASDGSVDVRRLERDVRALEREVAELRRLFAGVPRPVA